MAGNHQTLFEVNTRILTHELGLRLGRKASLADVPDSWIDGIADHGFDWVWLLGVWQTGEAGRRIAQSHKGLLAECRACLPDLAPDDIVGSPFAVQKYCVHKDFGGVEALLGLRRRLASRAIGLVLDFVPNHVAIDHPWVRKHPEFFVDGSDADLKEHPDDYVRVGDRILAHGRDPNFSGWSDTLQLNYGNAGLRQAMVGTLEDVSRLCDGVRCDMAMLVTEQVFAKTWEGKAPHWGGEFWPQAIDCVRRERRDFLFMAEVYWGMEAELRDLGFDLTYDKTFYDQLVAADAAAVRRRLAGDLDDLRRGVRFIENHDEPRAASAFSPEAAPSAAVLAALTPGMFLCHDGQREGRRAKLPVQLGRRPREGAAPELTGFYDRLLRATRHSAVGQDDWELLDIRPAWREDSTWESFVAFRWAPGLGDDLLVAVNLAPTRGQCYVGGPDERYRGAMWTLRDLLGTDVCPRDGDELAERGLFLDMPAWGTHAFAVGKGAS